ncbi:response regulator transcription factor [Neolewinella sp.]|uniref:response regulator transcription factor n=1 Tax=Neolewinella sp. TaxID=2993543 RepID=UPI003B521565
MDKSALVVEDDQDIVELLRIHLTDLDCRVTSTGDGHEGLRLGLAGRFDLIVLDVGLPGLDGTEICRHLRAKEVYTPVLMLTARSEEIDKVLGLEMGADDYLTKPFSVREFIARVRVIFRRMERTRSHTGEHAAGSAYRYGELAIDLDKRKVTIADRRIELSPKEFELLALLASKPGKCYARAQILNLVWGYDFGGYDHTVNSHINRLRAKIEPDAQHPTYILTDWGVGYHFSEKVDY